MNKRRDSFLFGIKDGVPIALAYLAVSFSLGVTVSTQAGLTPLQGALASLLCNASAGEYAGFSVIAADAPYIEIILATLVANARYFLMGCAISQRFNPKTKWYHRLLVGFDLTDELFAISVAHGGSVEPYYHYGAMAITMPCWAIGTALGAFAGNLMPANIVSALSVALYGMFIAIIIPPAKQNKKIAGIIAVCFVLSFVMSRIGVFGGIDAGMRTIILTVIISVAAALIFPVKEEKADEA